MLVIFLDIDGVLNSHQSIIKNGEQGIERPDQVFGKVPVMMIKDLIRKSGAHIVISSTWRIRDMSTVIRCFKKHGLPVRRIIGTTPILNNLERGDEIQKWLDETDYTVDSFVIIDDDTDMSHLSDYHVHVDRRVGFTKINRDKALQVLFK